ncbi:MAG TPA: guanylate kinase [Pirellulales bacterium]|jgi:guanylate kinase|nr:guanylate kinase [Pirellulales bacterium]
MPPSTPGRVVVISGPSGAGKTTLMKELFRRSERPLVASVSATTRPPRPTEVNGIDYHFLSHDDFAARRRAGDFLECFEVFGRGHWYGTLWGEVAPSLAAGKWVVLEIDVQGTRSVLVRYPDALTIFVGTESLEELERRLRGRGTESEDSIHRRLEVARRELAASDFYLHHVVNDTLDRAVQELLEILKRG